MNGFLVGHIPATMMSSRARNSSTTGGSGKENRRLDSQTMAAAERLKTFVDSQIQSMETQVSALHNKLTELQEKSLANEAITEDKIKGWIQAALANQPTQGLIANTTSNDSKGDHSSPNELEQSKHAKVSLQL